MGRPKGAKGKNNKYNYKPEYVQELRDYFDIEPYTVETKHDTKGHEVFYNKPCDIPTFAHFSVKINVARRILYKWKEEYPEFAEAWTWAQAMQEHILVTNGVLGNYDTTSWIFTAKNLIGYRSEKEVKHTGEISIVNLMDRISKKNSKKDFLGKSKHTEETTKQK